MRLPWWPILLGATVVLTPFVILWMFVEHEVPPSIDSALVLTAMMTGIALPVTAPATIVYGVILIISWIRRALHHRRLRVTGEII